MMPPLLDELTRNDPLAHELLHDAAAFPKTKANWPLLAQLKRETTALAEHFLNEYMNEGLDEKKIEEVNRALARIRIERKLTNVPTEFKEIYYRLQLIRDFNGRVIELDYPQNLADALMLRVCTPNTLKAAGRFRGTDVEPLITLITKAYNKMGLSQEKLAPSLAEDYRKLSVREMHPRVVLS